MSSVGLTCLGRVTDACHFAVAPAQIKTGQGGKCGPTPWEISGPWIRKWLPPVATLMNTSPVLLSSNRLSKNGLYRRIGQLIGTLLPIGAIDVSGLSTTHCSQGPSPRCMLTSLVSRALKEPAPRIHHCECVAIVEDLHWIRNGAQLFAALGVAMLAEPRALDPESLVAKDNIPTTKS